MNRFILNIIAGALAFGAAAGPASADPVWRFPHKGVPYATSGDSVYVAPAPKFAAPRAAKAPTSYAQARRPKRSLEADPAASARADAQVAPKG